MTNKATTVRGMPLDFSVNWVWPPLLMLLAAFLLRAASFRLSVIDWDESLYLLQAREWLRGGWPLVATWDIHPTRCRYQRRTSLYNSYCGSRRSLDQY